MKGVSSSDTPLHASDPDADPPARSRPDACLLWCHAEDTSDTGAMTALAQELARLRGEPVEVLFTSSTAQAASAVHDTTIRATTPAESDAAVARFLDTWTPDICIALGLPTRPRLFQAARARKTPMFLVASERGGFRSERRISAKLRTTIELFDACLAPSAADAQTMRSGGVDPDKIQITGPLSDTALAQPCEQRDLDDYAAMISARPVWLAARIARTEVDAIEAAQRRTIRAAHRLLLMLVPRTPADGPEIAQQLADKGWRVALQSRDEAPNETVQVFVADAGDDLPLWLRLAPITVLGGSFDADTTVTDPFEVAALGSAIVHGPHIEQTSRFARLKAAGATLEVASEKDLGESLFSLLSPENTARLAHAGWSVTSESAHVVEALAQKIDETLDRQEGT